MLGGVGVKVIHCRADAPRSDSTRAILTFFFLKNWRDLDFYKNKFQETEISCKKSEMSCESHWQEQPRSQGLSSSRPSERGETLVGSGHVLPWQLRTSGRGPLVIRQFAALSFVEFKARLIASRCVRRYPRCFTVAFRQQFRIVFRPFPIALVKS